MQRVTRPFDWRDKTVLVTGGTGTFGQAFTRFLLESEAVAAIRIFSRDELKQSEFARHLRDERVRLLLGDVRDRDRLHRAIEGVDVVVHAAALKQVPICEYNPFEAVKTNVLGAANVIDAAIDRGVGRVIALSTDKAANPINLYGATKLCAEKLVVQGNAYVGERATLFSCLRYGNVVASRGSVVPLFMEQRATGRVTITDRRMTRFWITVGEAVRFVKRCIEQMHGGEIFVPKLPSVRTVDLAAAVAPGAAVEEIGIRPGEKLNEVLVTLDESRHTLDLGDFFVIQPQHSWWSREPWSAGRPMPDECAYASDTNDRWLGIEEITKALPGALAEANRYEATVLTPTPE